MLKVKCECQMSQKPITSFYTLVFSHIRNLTPADLDKHQFTFWEYHTTKDAMEKSGWPSQRNVNVSKHLTWTSTASQLVQKAQQWLLKPDKYNFYMNTISPFYTACSMQVCRTSDMYDGLYKHHGCIILPIISRVVSPLSWQQMKRTVPNSDSKGNSETRL